MGGERVLAGQLQRSVQDALRAVTRSLGRQRVTLFGPPLHARLEARACQAQCPSDPASPHAKECALRLCAIDFPSPFSQQLLLTLSERLPSRPALTSMGRSRSLSASGLSCR